MKRLLVCSTIIVAGAVLLLPAAAPAFTGPLHGRPAAAAVPAKAASGLTAPQTAPLRGPLPGVLAGAATVTINVLSYAGIADPSYVEAYVWGDGDFGHARTPAATANAVLSGLPDAAANGEIIIIPQAGSSSYDLRNLSWSAGTNPNEMSVQPGWIPILIHRSSDDYYDHWTSAGVVFLAEQSGQHYEASTDIPQAGDSTYAEAATVSLGPLTLSEGAIYYGIGNEGAELAVAGVAISPGTTSGMTVETYEKDAQAVWTSGWGSGKPGTATWLGFERYPAGWINKVHGQASWPGSATPKSFGSLTMTGAQLLQVKKVTIPSTVKPGYAYDFTVSHTEGPLELTTWFQTCSLTPSKTTISHGGAVRLSGVVPTEGHLGSTSGKTKSVVIYKRTTSAGQPRWWDATRSGWTKVGVVKADGYGKYRSALLHPARSTWYVVRYPGDSQYWRAFTSVRKVTVR